MERVKGGEMYWYIRFSQWALATDSVRDCRDWFADGNFKTGNYFPTKEAAEKMVEKLNKVLKEG